MGFPGAGTRFGPYELQETIGLGGMGEVYRAYDTVRERMVALKLLRTDVAADPIYRDGGGEATVTKTGLIIGSCAYMATERLSGKPGGPASDVYSLTCLLFECLTGRAPFEAEDIRQVMSAHMFAPPPRPSLFGQGINPAFDEVVARGMAKNPADRFASAGELARAAAAAAHERPAPIAAARPAPPHSTRQFPVEQPRPYAPHQRPGPAASAKPPRFSRTQVALFVGTIAMFALAAGLAAAIIFTGGSDTSGSASTLAAPTPSTTDPSTTDPSTTSAAPISGVSGTDAQGFVGHAARCDAGSSLVAAIRTVSSLAVICQTTSGSYYYHGERLRDGANVQLANAVPASGGFDATNPADGARYKVRPDELTILSNGRVDSAEPALEYGSA